MFYKASLDTTTKVMSAFVAVLFVFLGNQSVTEIIASNDDLSTLLLHTWILLVMLTTFVGAYLFSVRGYLIKGDTLIIRRHVRPRNIAFADIESVRMPVPKEFSGTIRTFGVGGLFGYFGTFWNRRLGSMTWYATQAKNRVLIKTKSGKKIVITPDDVRLFDLLRSRSDNGV